MEKETKIITTKMIFEGTEEIDLLYAIVRNQLIGELNTYLDNKKNFNRYSYRRLMLCLRTLSCIKGSAESFVKGYIAGCAELECFLDGLESYCAQFSRFYRIRHDDIKNESEKD
jgi:hypothetical protein